MSTAISIRCTKYRILILPGKSDENRCDGGEGGGEKATRAEVKKKDKSVYCLRLFRSSRAYVFRVFR